jgi:hypothetical protein
MYREYEKEDGFKMAGAEDGPFICLEIPDEDTGEVVQKFVSIPVLFNRMWDDYIRGMMDSVYARGMLSELGLTGCEVFHMMERLQVGKAEFDAGDYQERSYV